MEPSRTEPVTCAPLLSVVHTVQGTKHVFPDPDGPMRAVTCCVAISEGDITHRRTSFQRNPSRSDIVTVPAPNRSGSFSRGCCHRRGGGYQVVAHLVVLVRRAETIRLY